MSSKSYRYYSVDSTGRSHGTQWLDADCDETAVAHVKARHPDVRREIWHEQRLVVLLGAHRKSDAVDQSLRTIANARRTLREPAHLVADELRMRNVGLPDTAGGAGAVSGPTSQA